MKKSRIARPIAAVASPAVRSLPLVALLVDTQAELFELMVRSGLRVLDAMLEEDRTALCGPRYVHQPARAASRAGTVPSEVVLGGRKVAVARPRVRADGREVPLPTFQALAHTDPLNRRVVEQMLVGVATRQYARSLESLPAGVVSRGTSKSSVSRRFVAKTTAQLRTWHSAPLDDLDLVALLLDGVHIGEHCLVVALGIAADGQKHALGLWEGATENAAVCQSFLANLQSRGLRTDRSLLVILDGALALHKSGARGLRRGRPYSAVPSPQAPQHPRPPAGATALVGPGDRAACLSGERREDGDATPHGSRQAPGRRISQRRRQRPRRAGRNADRAHAAPLDPPAAVARHDQRRRESAESHPPREAPRETVAWGTDDAAVGGCWCPRSRQGLPAPEGMRRYAPFGQRASRTRPTTGARCLRRERRVESHPSRRRVSTAVGTSPGKHMNMFPLEPSNV